MNTTQMNEAIHKAFPDFWQEFYGPVVDYSFGPASDLNAVARLEAKLYDEKVGDYLVYLAQITKRDSGVIKPTFATAPQRCEALLRTLGLWKEEE